MSTPQPDVARLQQLNDSALRAAASGDYLTAKAVLARILVEAPSNPTIWLNYAAACRGAGDFDAALLAIDEVLKREPRSFMALLSKGTLLERKGQIKKAIAAYRAAVQLAPPPDRLDESLRTAVIHARAVIEQYLEEYANYLNEAVGDFAEHGQSPEARRIRQFIDISLGRRPRYLQEPVEYFYPGLPPIEFWERDEFPWLPVLESATNTIRVELLGILQEQFKDFRPYVNYPDTVPLDQWAELNRSHQWGALHLFVYGERVEENCRRCPETTALLETFPMPRLPARSPAAMFSALQPQTKIPPHTGVSNTRLIVHLPLIVPAGCGFRVGNSTREWKEGQAWVFDDTIEHEAWNDSDFPRTILIFDIWNPWLNETERALLTQVIGAMDQFSGDTPAPNL
jgi:aspartate beta-hydroxylase